MKPRMTRPLLFAASISLMFALSIGLFARQPQSAAAANQFAELQQAGAPTNPEQDRPEKEPQVQAAGEDNAAWQEWAALPDDIKDKIDPRILAELSGTIRPAHLGGGIDQAEIDPHEQEALEQTRFLVYLQDQPDIVQVKAQAEAEAKAGAEIEASSVQAANAQRIAQRTAMLNTLVATTQQSQAAMRSTLELQMATGNVDGYHSFYIVNAIAVDGGLRSVIELAKRPDVDRIAANYPLVPLWDTTQKTFEQTPDFEGDLAPNWNIKLVGADRVWNELEVLGEGAVVAGFDTGVEYQHPALVEQYRGNLGNQEFNHNYSWFEPDARLYPDGNLGASISTQPTDCNYWGTHGTHTMGTMVGNAGGSNAGGGDSNSNRVGMAPRAQWIAVPGICYDTMPGGLGDDIGGIKAFQWLLCPTDLTGDLATADCSKAPDVINNSWGSANPFGNVFEPVVDALRAAGVASIFAAGNPEAGPSSIGSPANISSGISVGATDYQDNIAPFSAQGPSNIAGDQKPELSAPGVDVRSTVASRSYDTYSGTSMAAPHVAGLVALMISADLEDGVRDFNIDELERFMEATAVDLGAPGPDPIYGHGRIDAYGAVKWVAEAGDLQGTVYDSDTGNVIPNARAVGRSSAQEFTVIGGASGLYSLTVPVGVYNITVDAWGYEAATFPSQSVFPRSLSIADFSLTKLPTTNVGGVVQTGESDNELVTGANSIDTLPLAGVAVGNAIVRVQDHPHISTTTAADGSFALTLPTGEFVLQVEADQHRVYTTTVDNSADNPAGAVGLTLTPEAAPSILVVHADASGGWFFGWPVHPLVESVLQDESYQYDLWLIEDLDEEETYEDVDGSIRHGIPTTNTLAAYDVVIWLHSGCGGTYYCGRGGSPRGIGAEDELIGYLMGGGRLILSGQSIGSASDGNSPLFDEYLYADLVDGSAAGEGDAIFGNDFLNDLSLEVTNAALYGYSNGVLDLTPDAVLPQEDNGNVVPILSYENGNGAAALAVSPCGQDYRALYFSVGYESMGPRGESRSPDFNRVLDRGIDWLLAEKQDFSVSLIAEGIEQTNVPGSEVEYRVRLLNTGREEATIQLALTADGDILWNSVVFDAADEAQDAEPISLATPLVIAPCGVRTFTIRTEIPADAENGDSFEQLVVAELINGPVAGTADALVVDSTLTTRAFVQWARAGRSVASSNFSSVVAQTNDIYFYQLGGLDDYSYSYAGDQNHRYNVCTDEWETLAPIPVEKLTAASAILEGKVYLFGGREYDYYDYDASERTDSVLIYDIATDTWAEGQPIPLALRAATAAVADGKIYLFGGTDGTDDLATTFVYDPESDQWQELEPMPGGGRAYANAATAANGKIYVANGWPQLKRVEAYDPATDQWEVVASTKLGRRTGGMVAAPDGYLYVAGGKEQYNSIVEAERYDPETDTWETISSLNSGARLGSSLVYLAGRLIVVGGIDSGGSIETLAMDDSFCLSSADALVAGTEPGGLLSYVVEIVPDAVPLAEVNVTAQLPVSTTFAGFGTNEVGALYNADANRVEWTGALAPNTEPLTFTYDVQLDDISWDNGAAIPTLVRFENVSAELNTGPVFTSTISGRVYLPDLSASYFSADREEAIVGDELIYTVNLRSTTTAGGAASLETVVPDGLAYVADSLMYETGLAQYDAATRTITWTGRLESERIESVNNSEDYAWVDSQGDMSNMVADAAIEFEWEDVSKTGESVLQGDDRSQCGVEIGFAFDYYGETHTTICIDTNGRLFFDSFGYSDYYNACPISNVSSGDGTIAVLWDDLVVSDGVYVETLGVSPNRYMVVQWKGVDKYSNVSASAIEFEAILYETGEIKVQILEADYMTGYSSTSGVSNFDASAGATYACNTDGTIEDELAILFVPPGAGIGRAATDVSYSAKVLPEMAVNTTLTNTVNIVAASGSAFTRTVQARFNPVSIEAEAKIIGADDDTGANNSEVVGVSIGDPVEYQFVLRNTGPLTATNASLTFPIDESITYLPDSIACTAGACIREDGTDGAQLFWNGSVEPSGVVTITFMGILEMPLEDATIVEGTAIVDDGAGQTIEVSSGFVARSSRIVATLGRQITTFVEPATEVWYEIYVRNIGQAKTEAALDLVIPPGLTYVEGSVLCGRGSCQYADSTIQWVGAIAPRDTIPVRFAVLVPAEAIYGQQFIFDATVTDQSRQEQVAVEAASIVIARNTRLPMVFTTVIIRETFLPMVAGE